MAKWTKEVGGPKEPGFFAFCEAFLKNLRVDGEGQVSLFIEKVLGGVVYSLERPEDGKVFDEGFCPEGSKVIITEKQFKAASPIPAQRDRAVAQWMNMTAEATGVVTEEEYKNRNSRGFHLSPNMDGAMRVYFFPGERGFAEEDRERMLGVLGQDRGVFTGKWTMFPGRGLDAKGQVFREVTEEVAVSSLDQVAERYDVLCDLLIAYNPKLGKRDPKLQVLGNEEEGKYFVAMSQVFLQAVEKCEKIGIDVGKGSAPDRN